MTNSVFSTMQDIENVATDIIKSYDNEIYTYKAVSQKELEKLEKSYDEKSHEELISIESNLEMKQQNLIDEVNKTIKENDAKIIVRGLRAVTDYENEMQIAQTNRQICEDIETLFLITSLEYAFLSSTIVKEIASFGKDVSNWVPKAVEDKLREKFRY